MPAFRAEAIDRAEMHYNGLAVASQHREQAHRHKSEAANHIVMGYDNNDLDEEAELRGMTRLQLAELILSKPDELMPRENERQRVKFAIARAKTREDIADIMAEAKIPPAFPGFTGVMAPKQS